MVSTFRRGGNPHRQRRYRRRAIVLVDVVDVEVYQAMIEERRVASPIPCPDKCSEAEWKRHSQFERQWVDYDCLAYGIVIIRVRCSRCRGVWSLFPGFVWYRFQYNHRLIQSSCTRALERSATAVAEELHAHVSPIVEERGRCRVPAESTIRSWMKWLGRRCLEPLLQSTVGLIAQRGAEAARAVLPVFDIRPGLSPTAERRERVKLVAVVAAALDAVTRGRANIFRRAPNQLRDWGRSLFREQRLILARPP